MKKLILLTIALLSFTVLNAQFISSGKGTKFSPQMLADSAGAFFLVNGANFELSNQITISANDTLEIMSGDTLFMAADGVLRIEGVMLAMPDDVFIITASDTTLGYEGFTFVESVGSLLQNIDFSYGGGVKLLYSDVHFYNCSFFKMTNTNGSGAIDMLQSNPVIEECSFYYNLQSAIASSATASSSPVIKNCYLYRNNTENGNRPQINLGTSDGFNDIIIKHNIIEGFYDEAGGISVATLAGGSISAILDSNIISGNRYGLNVQGNVTGQIIGNHFVDNNIEDNPMYGGSGISFYSGCTPIVAHNIITGNLWGITIPNAANPNLGQVGEETVNVGHNYIYDNGNGGTIYNLYNNSAEEIFAQNNYWGTTSAVEAGEGIVDNADNSSLGVVHYEPIYLLSDDSRVLSLSFHVEGNWIEVPIDEENHEITAELPANTDLSNIQYEISISDYASYTMSNDELQTGVGDFTTTVTATVIAEDSISSINYSIDITSPQSISQNDDTNVQVYPNPSKDYFTISSDKAFKLITITNSYGALVESLSPRYGDYRVDVSGFVSSVYYVNVFFEDGSQVIEKIIIQ
jgi:hypothetical protein